MEEYCQPPNIFTEVLKTIHNESGGSVLGGFIPNTQQMLDQSINLVTWALVHSIYRRVSIHLMQAFKKDIESLIPNTNLDLPDAEQEILDEYQRSQRADDVVWRQINEGVVVGRQMNEGEGGVGEGGVDEADEGGGGGGALVLVPGPDEGEAPSKKQRTSRAKERVAARDPPVASARSSTRATARQSRRPAQAINPAVVARTTRA